MTDRFWELMARYWSGEITQEEKPELEKYLLDHPEYWLKAGLTENLSYKATPLLSTEDALRLADDIQDRVFRETFAGEASLPSKNWFTRQHTGLLLAAMLCGILMLAAYYYREVGTSSWEKIATAPGTKKNVVLADGTTIRLNAGSVLRYPGKGHQQDKIREVFLEGEAYFDVKPNAGRPFIIHAGKMDVKVLGTELNVRVYPDEGFSETALVKGAVEVMVKSTENARTYRLKPGQKVVAKYQEAELPESGTVQQMPAASVTLQPVSKVNDNTIAETAWKEDKLVFQDETLAALALRLERWYGVKITINNTALASKRFTGRADNVPLPHLLEILQAITPFDFSIKGGDVTIQ
ncbi:FecR domain-containing protein [Chitinophaga sp. MM2321]|uniref:FecR family protein n=1 Tax=Chitinophaga sp. MM2321 TaxID=3137178 RepID=UPI0032D58170